MNKHHHAFSWQDIEWPVPSVRRLHSSATPPMVRAEWLLKPAELHRGQYDTPSDAVAWIALRLGVTPPAPTDLEPSVIEQMAVVKVAVGGDFSTEYRSKKGEWVVLSLIACPRPGIVCPTLRNGIER